MSQTITTNLAGLDKALAKIGDNLPQAIEAGLDRGAQILHDRDMTEVQKTYKRVSHYTYKNAKGKPRTAKWERTGDMAKGWTIKKSTGKRELVMEGNAGKAIKNYPGGYSQKLATLPVSKDGKSRANPHAKNAVKVTKPYLQRLMEDEVKKKLGL